jgi:hypothetical protein
MGGCGARSRSGGLARSRPRARLAGYNAAGQSAATGCDSGEFDMASTNKRARRRAALGAVDDRSQMPTRRRQQRQQGVTVMRKLGEGDMPKPAAPWRRLRGAQPLSTTLNERRCSRAGMAWCDWGVGTHRELPRQGRHGDRHVAHLPSPQALSQAAWYPSLSPGRGEGGQGPRAPSQWPRPRGGRAAAGWHSRCESMRAPCMCSRHWPLAAQEPGACCRLVQACCSTPCALHGPPPAVTSSRRR